MKNRPLVVAALAVLGALGTVVPTALGQVWAVQPAQQRIVIVDPVTGTIMHSFAAPDALAPGHRAIGLSIAEGDGTLLYHNSHISTTTVYRLNPMDGSIMSPEPRSNAPIDGLSWQMDPSGQPYLYLSHFNDDVDRPTAYGGSETNNWQGQGVPRGGLGGDGHGREFMIGNDGKIYEYSPFTRGVGIRNFPAPSAGAALEGLAYDGVWLYASDTAGNLFTIDPNTGAASNPVTIPGGGLYGLGARRPITTTCQPGDLVEGEFQATGACGIPVDTFNGGCNSTPEVYSPILCGDVICGTAAFDGSIRDTDWYQVCITTPSTLTWFLQESEFDWAIFILGGPCASLTVYAVNSGISGDSGYVTSPCLPPGCYYLFVAPQFNWQRPCPSDYRVELQCVKCVACQPGDVIEGEPNCGIPVDTFNGGCNSTPEVYSHLNCGDTACGSGAFDGSTRDTDWYEVCLQQDSSITWTLLESDFDWVIFIIGAACTPITIYASATGPAGSSGSITFDCLPPGCYHLFVAPAFNTPVPCPSNYRVHVDCKPCPFVTCLSTDTPERELQATGDCGAPVDTFNGGCNSVPVGLLSPISCGDIICGTAEFDGSIRDTDWYELCLGATTYVTWSVLDAEFDWVAYIMTPGCPPTILGSSTGPAFAGGSSTLCLPAGCYVLFIAPQFTTQEACPADYRVQVTCSRGTCQSGADCNENKIDDAQDIASGFSRDCFDFLAAPGTAGGPNGVPDECECIADWNRDGVANSTDVSDFINTFFADQVSGGLTGDINCDGVSNSTDVSDFINTYFAAQAGQLPFAGCTI